MNTAYYGLHLPRWPGSFGAIPIITVQAGSRDLRRLTVTIFERRQEHQGMTCTKVAQGARCSPHSVYNIAYVPAGGTLTLDGQTCRAVIECADVCETSPDAYGRDGRPLTFPLLDCDRYCVVIEVDAIATPAADATISLALSGREH
ncbi:hypothetical protein [Streptomyces chrestomyceticus]|uniref:hypothetical protein n=1 Tax=Streptomyces chrestomyceticus TaxID=68185 RepID=UPI0019D24842|nr:hypothetical protein [Streptomyces chrestomyceticus]